MIQRRFHPELLVVLKEGYSRSTLIADLLAGIVVGIVALPLAIAFGIASGVKPEQGLYTAIIAGFVVALLGGSRVQVTGPTGAFIVIIYGIVVQHGYRGLAVATFIAGGMLVIMGLLRMGALLKFVPYPVTIGFTSGIAVIIFSSQISDFFGLALANIPAHFIEKWLLFARHISNINLASTFVATASLCILAVWPKVSSRVPGPFIVVVGSSVFVYLLGLNVDTIASRFGAVPSTLPTLRIPVFDLKLFREMVSPALTIALLGAIESLLSASVSDGMLGTRHHSNTELIAQGIGNMLSPLFGGIPATGAIARTATNVKNGGRTPVAASIHAATLLLIMICFGDLAGYIPMSALAAILVYVAYSMSEWRVFVRMFSAPRSDVMVMLITFALTVLVDLTVAIEAGVVLAAFLFLQRMETSLETELITSGMSGSDEIGEGLNPILAHEVPKGVALFALSGPLFFAAVDRFRNAIKRIGSAPKVLILRMRHVSSVDASGLYALEEVFAQAEREGSRIMLTAVQEQPMRAMEKAGLIERLGPEYLFNDIYTALERARELVKKNQ